MFANVPPPKTLLGRYRLLAPTAGVRVSPICFGAMNIGSAWNGYMGKTDRAASEAMLDAYYEAGGNFIDTANNYQDGESEEWLGAWMEKRQNRDQLVVATKYTSCWRRTATGSEIVANTVGNSTKSMVVSLNASLARLRTSYVDLFYVHWWDHSTDIPELMQSLNQLVAAGKVLYLGISDAPAWVVSKANEYARGHGLRPFCVYQGRWSAASRDFEREIIPMARAEGMALAPWGALGAGTFKTEAQRQVPAGSDGGRVYSATPEQIAVSRVLESIAAEKGTLLTSVALAYVIHKAPHVFPIVGSRSPAQLAANIDALGLALSDADIAAIEGAVPFDPGFPHNFLSMFVDGNNSSPTVHYQNTGLLNMAAVYDYVPEPQAIRVPKAE